MSESQRVILLVEDNHDDALLTLRALKKSNVLNEVVVATDGAEALDYLLGTGRFAGVAPPVLPQVVLLDLNLPKIGGLEVLRQIRANERTRLLPVVILTTSNEDRDMVQGYSLGANSYVRKPVEFERFAEAVREIGVYWLLVNRTTQH